MIKLWWTKCKMFDSIQNYKTKLCYFPYTNKISRQRILLASCYWANRASIHQTRNNVKANMSKHDNKHWKHIYNNKTVDFKEKINRQNNYICVRQFSIRSKVYLYHLSERGDGFEQRKTYFTPLYFVWHFPKKNACINQYIQSTTNSNLV